MHPQDTGPRLRGLARALRGPQQGHDAGRVLLELRRHALAGRPGQRPHRPLPQRHRQGVPRFGAFLRLLRGGPEEGGCVGGKGWGEGRAAGQARVPRRRAGARLRPRVAGAGRLARRRRRGRSGRSGGPRRPRGGASRGQPRVLCRHLQGWCVFPLAVRGAGLVGQAAAVYHGLVSCRVWMQRGSEPRAHEEQHGGFSLW
mmetsp:Transcript_99987/g.278495  ORF Transcript_99987/g.278495 Transcript_99987/m.278495 type:complete len:200 (+) Transcript_99987:593-1192(+)